MIRRMTRQELKAEKEARNAYFAQFEEKTTTAAEERALNQIDKLIDRGLIQWWK